MTEDMKAAERDQRGRQLALLGESLVDMNEVKMLRPCECAYPGVYVHFYDGMGAPVVAREPRDSAAVRAWIRAGCPIPESPSGTPFDVTAWHEAATGGEHD